MEKRKEKKKKPNLETQCEKERKEEKRRRRRRQCVLERAKGLTGFDYSLTMGLLNMCVFTKMLS